MHDGLMLIVAVGSSVVLAVWFYVTFVMPALSKMLPKGDADEKAAELMNKHRSTGSGREERYRTESQPNFALEQFLVKDDILVCRLSVSEGSMSNLSITSGSRDLTFSPNQLRVGDELLVTVEDVNEPELRLLLEYTTADGSVEKSELRFDVPSKQLTIAPVT